MENRWKLTGEVVTGAKKAAYFTQLNWVQEQCMEKLGFEPYPGTLNLDITGDDLPVIEELQKEEGVMLIPTDPEFCTARALPVVVGAVKGAIIIPAENVKVHGSNIVEIMAPVNLRDALKVNDGNSLTLVIERSGDMQANR
ncbi:MAG: DUF120 domain-containing protein [Thermodesulfobacteriota bacterium]|nr:DUF120 domain-containing protein [Thermodesulfobacteriota bacterium]